MKKKVLIIGFGSIGKRHAELFHKLDCEVALVTKQSNEQYQVFNELNNEAIAFAPEFILITNETSKHLTTVQSLVKLGYKGVVLVEKPLFDQVVEKLEHSFKGLYVLYNLRMNLLLLSLKNKLKDQQIVNMNVYCGQYLPSWRPARDYRTTYSAKKEEGGGVIRDLSHELDYATWIGGDFVYLSALGGHLSNLEITSDDMFHILGKCKNAASMNITINYLDRTPKRFIVINTNDHTYTLDMIKGDLIEDGVEVLSNIKAVDSYLDQAKNILNHDFLNFCSFDHAQNILKLIQVAELSSKEKRIISL